MYIDCESVYSSSSAVKQTSETLQKKIKPLFYPCWLTLSWRSRFRSIDLTCRRSTNHCEFLKGFWSKVDSSHFDNFPSFHTSWICSDVFQINEKFIPNCLPCFLAEMAKVASSIARTRKCYINRLERFI